MIKERFVWIDHAKGVAILLVLMGHLINASLESSCSDSIKMFIYSFHMPLFFFLSGIVMSSYPTKKKLLRKLCVFLAPFFIVGVGYSYFVGLDFEGFMYNRDKYGYWYLFVLAVFYLLHYLMGLPKKLGLKSVIYELIIAAVCFAAIWYTTKLPTRIGGLLSAMQMYFNWPFFVTGFFVRKHIDIVKRYGFICPLALATYIVSSIIFEHTQVLGTLTYYLRGMGMIVFLISLLQRSSALESSFVGRQLSHLGSKTLDIYIFHYFFVCMLSLRAFGAWLTDTHNYFIELLFVVAASIIISYCSIWIGNVIRAIPYVRNIVYGKRF